MLRIANEERPWMEMLPTQGATIGELTLSMQQYPVQQGHYLPYIIIMSWVGCGLQNNAGSAGVKG